MRFCGKCTGKPRCECNDLATCVGCRSQAACRGLLSAGAPARCYDLDVVAAPRITDDLEGPAPAVDLSVAVKADGDKVRTDLLPVGPMLAIAEVLTFGAKKYADHNWRQGFKWSRLLGAAMRHLFAFLRGEDKDPETGLSHLAHLGCCVMFLLEHEQRGLGEDDRYKA